MAQVWPSRSNSTAALLFRWRKNPSAWLSLPFLLLAQVLRNDAKRAHLALTIGLYPFVSKTKAEGIKKNLLCFPYLPFINRITASSKQRHNNDCSVAKDSRKDLPSRPSRNRESLIDNCLVGPSKRGETRAKAFIIFPYNAMPLT